MMQSLLHVGGVFEKPALLNEKNCQSIYSNKLVDFSEKE